LPLKTGIFELSSCFIDYSKTNRITSFDPLPRAECDALCDHIVRSRLDDADLAVFDDTQPGDVLYMDGSHRCFQNSDVTVFFLEVLPRLRPGVIVGVHDIFLPEDYPPRRMGRFYSEQYVMAAYMLGRGDRLEILLLNHFVSRDQELSGILAPLAGVPSLAGVPIEGWLIWFRKT